MNKQDLWNKRVIPGFDRMYREAECVVPEIHESQTIFSWDDIVKYSYKLEEDIKGYRKGTVMVPFLSFYLPQSTQSQIVKDACRYLRRSVIWNKNCGMSLEEFTKLKKEIKNLPPKQRREEIKKLLKQGFSERSFDGEFVRFNLVLTCSPSSEKDTKYWDMVKTLPKGLSFMEVLDKTNADAASIYYFYWSWKQDRE